MRTTLKSVSIALGAALLAVPAATQLAIVPAAAAAGGFHPLTASQARRLAANADVPVIVLLKSQPAQAQRNTAAATTRANRIAAAQRPLRSELAKVHAKRVRSFALVNAVAGTVSRAEANRLATDPDVVSVIPDSLVRGAAPANPAASTGSTGAGVDAPGNVCPAAGKTMLEPEALSVTHTDSDDPSAPTARKLGYTGAGVKVAYIAEGIDIDNPDFIRADGSRVFADYQDFTGDGPDAPTSGGEAFLDASAIAAQGRVVHNVADFAALPLRHPCNVRIEGMAPGASLYGYKVFGDTNYSTTSAILQAIDWAVNVDHVDVINQSFGYNPFPDTTSMDVTKLFDRAAVAAGVTVTVSSGDAGTNSTEGSPATDPGVISAGASTTFRFYQQADYAGARQFGQNGWLNDNVSSLSSSGFTQDGSGIDLLAPGDSSWATCTPDPDLYEDCVSFAGQPADVERSGGTSESAPLTAGAAALVIQAYRKAHGGSSPTPALVKQILVSTADDLTIPGDEQGAGRLNSFKAVEAAASIGSSHRVGATVLTSKAQLVGTGNPGSAQQWKLKVTNTGAGAQTVALSGRTFGPEQHVADTSVVLTDSGPHFQDWADVRTNYRTRTFTVTPGAERLNASIVYPGDPTASLNARVRLILVDPLGRYAAHSVPQGVGNYGHVDVRFPTAGTWTAVIFSRDTSNGGTVGRVGLRTSTQRTVGFGAVTPAVLTLRPGQSRTVTVRANTPAAPGDGSAAVVLNAGVGGQTSVPILLRSLVPLAGGSGSFRSVLTGGNGRQPNIGQGNYYAFDVPVGATDLAASVSLSANAADNVNIFLIDPNGVAQAIGTNKLAKTYDPTNRTGHLTSLLDTDAYVLTPKPGRWTLSVNFAGAVVGNRQEVPFTGRIGLDSVRVAAHGLPTGGTLAAGTPVTVPVVVHNTGSAPQHFFVDARTDSMTALTLAPVLPATVPIPLPGDAATPAWLVPSQTRALAITAAATRPMMFDYGPEAGDPDLASGHNGLNPVGAIAGNPLPAGLWSADPSELGPTPIGGGAAGSVTFAAEALTKGFDPAVSSTADDYWRTSVTPSTKLRLITVPAGASATIPVTVTPQGAPGALVRGTLYVDQFVVGSTETLNAINFADPAPTEATANQLAALPYTYRIA